MWGAGNLGDRRPQFRAEWTPKAGPGNFILQGEVGLTGADDGQDLDPAAAGGFRDGEASGKPALQARVAYALPPLGKAKAGVGRVGPSRVGTHRHSCRCQPAERVRQRGRGVGFHRPALQGPRLVERRVMDWQKPFRRARRHSSRNQYNNRTRSGLARRLA